MQEGVIGFKEDIRTVFFRTVLCQVALQYAFLENSRAYFAVAVTAYLETAAECIDCLDADTVQTNALFECLAVVFTAGIQFAGLPLPAFLAECLVRSHVMPMRRFSGADFDTFAGTHLEFIDTVVHYLFFSNT